MVKSIDRSWLKRCWKVISSIEVENYPYTALESREEVAAMLKWEQIVDNLPNWEPPHWLLVRMDRFFPYKCQFERTVRVSGVLIYYVPALCRLNPYFNAIMRYRESKIQPISFWD